MDPSSNYWLRAVAPDSSDMKKFAFCFLCGFVFFLLANDCDASAPLFYIKARPDNDLVLTLQHNRVPIETKTNLDELLRVAPNGASMLILADDYPVQPTQIPTEFWNQAHQKSLKLYVEYSANVPGVEFGAPEKPDWSRLIISTDRFGKELPRLQIMVAQDCQFLKTVCDNPLVVIGRVAGYNTAVYGIPTNASPILFEKPELNAFIATTKLSQFITARYAPYQEWRALWNWLLNDLSPGHSIDVDWTPAVTAAYAKNAPIGPREEMNCFKTGEQWYLNSGLLVSDSRWPQILNWIKTNGGETAYADHLDHLGDGSNGILEGYASGIRFDGQQKQRIVFRADCQAESAMVFAVNNWLHHDRRSQQIARNLLNFVYFKSDMCGGVRADATNPNFGLIGWGGIAPAWTVQNYGDDEARTMLATMLAAACMGSDDWNESLLKALHANLRTSGQEGFRGSSISVPELEKNGWKYYNNRHYVYYSPHFEAYPWACYLWAYHHSGYRPFLEKAKSAIGITMAGFPNKWIWNDNMERAHMLLGLSWLVRLEDTPEHRRWAKTVAMDLLSVQDDCGGLTERFRVSSSTHYRVAASNEAYGVSETPLLQENGDPVTDQLYVSGFSLLGLHEAAMALNDNEIKAGEDRLAQYLCRIQNRSKEFPFLNGSWFRAFDHNRWEGWASSGDIGWGAWSVETGWANAWTLATLGLRARHASLWDLTDRTTIMKNEHTVENLMSKNTGGPWVHPSASN